jgi:dTDP-4-dehydrorhamnose reductase/dTDP-4-dehydrorhamnose 3,5-epimerase
MESSFKFSKPLQIHETLIPGLIVFDLPVYGDSRGWFKENWQREKMVTLGLPDFSPVQNNISFNEKRGVTRGIHAEPWDKFVSIAAGRIFGAWVDIRAKSSTYGQVFTIELDPSKAIFVPAGVANSYQTLEDQTVYSYLVNDHWSPDAKYTFINIADESLGIKWPIALSESEISDKDKAHPMLIDVIPMEPKKTLIIGTYGQLGRALQKELPTAELVDRDTFDMSNSSVITSRNWHSYSTIINAAAYTAVDLAETSEGRCAAWLSNSTAVSYLSQIASQNNITLVHISSDYVFDGTIENHTEDEPLSPLGVYGQTKAAGDIAASLTLKHYILRTSWVIGDGNNFVRTMRSLAEKNVTPNVVSDQIGRLTFTSDLAKAIKHLLDIKAPYGTYNVSGDGEPASWADIAKQVYELSGKPSSDVTPISTADYYAGKDGIAPRPLQSTLNLDKIKATGFVPREWREALRNYLDQQ